MQTQLEALTTEQLAFLAEVAAADADGDGLTDDQEGFWCTNPAKADSDLDGTNDGAEVEKLKAWLKHELFAAPSSGKPFSGWPSQTSACPDIMLTNQGIKV